MMDRTVRENERGEKWNKIKKRNGWEKVMGNVRN